MIFVILFKVFFASGKMLKVINHAVIALIPKVKHFQTMGDLRPIRLCIVLYKIIYKILLQNYL